MTIEKLFPSGAYEISDIIDDYLVTKKYMGYTKKEAIAEFKAEFKTKAN